MKLSSRHSTIRQIKADVAVVFVSESKTTFSKDMGVLRKYFKRKLDNMVEMEQFKGKRGEILGFFTDGATATPRLLLVGLGEEKNLTLEQLRRSAAAATKRAADIHADSAAFLLPKIPGNAFSSSEAAKAISEGAWLSQYRFEKYITSKEDRKDKVKELTIVTENDVDEKSVKKVLQEVRIICEATELARDLANAPPNEIYPESLATVARQSAARHGYRIQVWDKPRIEQMKFGGLLAVNAGSNKPPRFIILEHHSAQKNLPTVVLVGKGVTFDAGGISIKPAGGMSEMKMDMSGAAAVIGTMEATARLNLPVHLVGLIPATENLLGGSAMKPGDIITHYGGKTSEVDNTDAEGRLILADALAYASIYKPAAVIDLATLTGACVVALGQHTTGMMGTDDELMANLKAAGEKTFERLWQLPLFEEYEKQIKSDVADVKNTGGRWAGAITAALFLKKFIGDYKWVHLDIAGPAILEESQPYAAKGGSGIGVRLLVEYLKSIKPT